MANTNTQSEWSRRGFLKIGAAGAVACSLRSDLQGRGIEPGLCGDHRRSVIIICNLGGPSQLDTWDPKPDAEQDVRGPFRAIQTRVPGVCVSELFPRHAQITQHLAFVRSCYHTSPAIHHAGWQCMLTGRESVAGLDLPHIGCLVGYLLGGRGGLPPHVLLPTELRTAATPHATGQSSGILGPQHAPRVLDATDGHRWPSAAMAGVDRELTQAVDLSPESKKTRLRFGNSPFGRRCLAARRLVAAGVRCVTINTFVDLLHQDTWDVHGRTPFGPVTQLRNRVAPHYDQAVSALIEDLFERGMLDDTLVCCLAEFGRTPRMNPDGGRDHWPQCFTTYFAGGGVQGGRVVGRSDATASAPAERPVQPPEIVASICHSLGLASTTPWVNPGGDVRPLVDTAAQPIWELF